MLTFLRPYLFWTRCYICNCNYTRYGRRVLRSKKVTNDTVLSPCSSQAFSTTARARRLVVKQRWTRMGKKSDQFLSKYEREELPPNREPGAEPADWEPAQDAGEVVSLKGRSRTEALASGYFSEVELVVPFQRTHDDENEEKQLETAIYSPSFPPPGGWKTPDLATLPETNRMDYDSKDPRFSKTDPQQHTWVELESDGLAVEEGTEYPSEDLLENDVKEGLSCEKSMEESAQEMKQFLESFFPSPNENENGNEYKKIPWMDVGEEVRKAVENKPTIELTKREFVRQVFANSARTVNVDDDKDDETWEHNILLLSNLGSTMLMSDISRIAYHLNKQGVGRAVTQIIPVRDTISLQRKPSFVIYATTPEAATLFRNMVVSVYDSDEMNESLTLPPTTKPRVDATRIKQYRNPKLLHEDGSAPARCVLLHMSGCPRSMLTKMLEDRIIRSTGVSPKLLNGGFELGRSCVDILGFTSKQKPNQAAWLLRFGEGYEAEADRIEREWHQKEIQIPRQGVQGSEGPAARNYTVLVQAEVTRW